MPSSFCFSLLLPRHSALTQEHVRMSRQAGRNVGASREGVKSNTVYTPELVRMQDPLVNVAVRPALRDI